MRFFNTAGPCVPEKHYTLPPMGRINLPELEGLIADERYFILHAPRQTGKTSALLALMKHFNAQGKYRALYANVEGAQTARNDIRAGVSTICRSVAEAAETWLGDRLMLDRLDDILSVPDSGAWLRTLLREWSLADPAHPILLMLDEVDALVGDTLISLLRQLRAGYTDRPQAFPQAVILCGLRDIRDYRIHTGGGEIITGGSCFNIKAESIRMGDFTKDDIVALYAQYTAQTGHEILPEAIDLVWNFTQGQPWLVNALAREALEKAKPNRTVPATAEDFQEAKERLILRRETHLDQLAFRLKEPRVLRIIEPMLTGQIGAGDFPPDDVQYLIDLGLIKRATSGKLTISNGIYQEVIPRELTWTAQSMVSPPDTPWFVAPDGRLDMDKLLLEFQDFYREHSEIWLERYDYKEAGPHLILQAFLQRIVNGGGRIDREYGMGRKRADLYLQWKMPGGGHRRYVLELKLQRGTKEAALAEALPQTAEYADRCRADETHILLFDVRPGQMWEEKISRETATHAGRDMTVWGL